MQICISGLKANLFHFCDRSLDRESLAASNTQQYSAINYTPTQNKINVFKNQNKTVMMQLSCMVEFSTYYKYVNAGNTVLYKYKYYFKKSKGAVIILENLYFMLDLVNNSIASAVPFIKHVFVLSILYTSDFRM